MSNGMNRMNKGELLTFIDEVTFALDDLTLYLDTHPHCEKALSRYETYKAMRNQAVKDYVNMYGPLNRYQVNDSNYFNWVDGPWPWERKCDC